jgi:hypothetical protein
MSKGKTIFSISADMWDFFMLLWAASYLLGYGMSTMIVKSRRSVGYCFKYRGNLLDEE